MRIFSLVFVCLFLSHAAIAQTDGNVVDEEVTVEEITLSRDDGSGGIGEKREAFLPNDFPIHCSIVLSSVKSATVKMNIVFVKSVTPKVETKVVSVNYKTNGKQNMVNFNGSPAKTWAIGNYRVDIYVDAKLSQSRDFEVVKSMNALKVKRQTVSTTNLLNN
jgi:hypothetical protein